MAMVLLQCRRSLRKKLFERIEIDHKFGLNKNGVTMSIFRALMDYVVHERHG